MVLLWLGLVAAATAPQLHSFLHKDSQSPNHNCVVTQVQQQTFLSGCPTVAVAAPVFIVTGLLPIAPELVVSQRDYLLSPGRAPPVPFFSSVVAG